jgi:lysophospholipase L1-like esterase
MALQSRWRKPPACRRAPARLIWARTTPFGEKVLEGEDESAPLNQVADEIMMKHGIPLADLHAAVLDKLASVQSNDHTHFNADGIKLLAAQVVKVIEPFLAKP